MKPIVCEKPLLVNGAIKRCSATTPHGPRPPPAAMPPTSHLALRNQAIKNWQIQESRGPLRVQHPMFT